MDSIIFNQVINFINPGITTLVSTIIIGDYISIDDGFELIQYRVGYLLNIHGGIYLNNSTIYCFCQNVRTHNAQIMCW